MVICLRVVIEARQCVVFYQVHTQCYLRHRITQERRSKIQFAYSPVLPAIRQIALFGWGARINRSRLPCSCIFGSIGSTTGGNRPKAEIAHIQNPAPKGYSQKIISLERTGTVAEVAQAYLCATTNTFLTRQTLVIDGGLGLLA
jgi:hypothetical protein